MTPAAIPTPVQPTLRQRRRRPNARAFTLLECSLAMVILAVGVLALIESQAYFFSVNQFSSRAATGAYLAGELRERMRMLPKHDPVTGLFKNGGALVGWGPETGETQSSDYDDLDDFDGAQFGNGAAFSGPIDSDGRVIAETDVNGVIQRDGNDAIIPMRGWQQRVIVDKVEPTNYATVRSDDHDNTGSAPILQVNQYALRVTIVVTYTAPGETGAAEMARMVFIAP